MTNYSKNIFSDVKWLSDEIDKLIKQMQEDKEKEKEKETRTEQCTCGANTGLSITTIEERRDIYIDDKYVGKGNIKHMECNECWRTWHKISDLVV